MSKLPNRENERGLCSRHTYTTPFFCLMSLSRYYWSGGTEGREDFARMPARNKSQRHCVVAGGSVPWATYVNKPGGLDLRKKSRCNPIGPHTRRLERKERKTNNLGAVFFLFLSSFALFSLVESELSIRSITLTMQRTDSNSTNQPSLPPLPPS